MFVELLGLEGLIVRSGATMEVEEWVMGHETAQDMLRRIGPRTTAVAPLVPALQGIVNLHGRHVLEVTGASGSAKSEFLLQVQALSRMFIRHV